ncbi:MAG: divalent-cation tolerance protein CutA [Polaromonas sp.]
MTNHDIRSAMPCCIVLTTTADEAQAETLARQIVEARLGACVQIQPIRSFYRWKDALCDQPEWRLSIKTRCARFEALAQFISAHHPYETPEIVQIPITDGSAAYLRWVDDETQA